MSRQSQRHRSRSLPFEYREDGLNFELKQYRIDKRKPKVIDSGPGEATVDISPSATAAPIDDRDAWERATLYGVVTVEREVLEDIFPDDERDAPPAKLYVAVRCHDTIYRDSVAVKEAPTTADEYDVEIELDWEDFRGIVELRPYLVRTEARDGTGPYASTRNVKVASGDRYELVVDRWDEDAPPAIDGEEASFSQTQHLPDDDELYYLDFRNEERPKLWINADHPRIADVLRSEGSVGAEPRMRDVVLDQISYAVWSQLVLRAATAIDSGGDVEYEWQETVLEAFAPDMYDVDDVDDAMHLLRDDVGDPDGLARLVPKLDSELQKFVDPQEQFINLIEEGLQI